MPVELVGEQGLNSGKTLMLGMARLAGGCVRKIFGLSNWEVGMPFTDAGKTRTIMYQALFLAAQELEQVLVGRRSVLNKLHLRNTMQRCHVHSWIYQSRMGVWILNLHEKRGSVSLAGIVSYSSRKGQIITSIFKAFRIWWFGFNHSAVNNRLHSSGAPPMFQTTTVLTWASRNCSLML